MNALRTWRKDQGFTIEQMAERLDVSVGSLSRIERDDQWPDREFLARVAEVTEGAVTPNDFVLGPRPAPEPEAA